MTVIRMNPYAVMVDGETLMDAHRAEWLSAAGRLLAPGHRLVYDSGCDPDCVNPEHARAVPLQDAGTGLFRAIIPAVSAQGRRDDWPAWSVVLEGPALDRWAVGLQPEWYDRLGIEEAAELLEREVLVQRYEDDSVELYAVPEDDDQLPGGLPAWHVVDVVDFTALDEVACPCGSRWRFDCCHGR